MKCVLSDDSSENITFENGYYFSIEYKNRNLSSNRIRYASEMEFLLKECKVELVKFGGKPVKGAMGEDLMPIKLRVVGYK